jgi:hypothetical protein
LQVIELMTDNRASNGLDWALQPPRIGYKVCGSSGMKKERFGMASFMSSQLLESLIGSR